jgi:hypothetical protein
MLSVVDGKFIGRVKTEMTKREALDLAQELMEAANAKCPNNNI